MKCITTETASASAHTSIEASTGGSDVVAQTPITTVAINVTTTDRVGIIDAVGIAL